MLEVPTNEILRQQLAQSSDGELVEKLSSLRQLHNSTDILNRERLVRAIEIGVYKQNNITEQTNFDFSGSLVFGIRFDRKTVRSRITERLAKRLNEGMIEEVEQLLESGISADRLKLYGLEYKYVAMFLVGELSKDEMSSLLNTAIHQFAKRQMTWFRRMEKNGIKINWLEGEDGMGNNLEKVLRILEKSSVAINSI
jgi:tRNA dimethylallyltransferase